MSILRRHIICHRKSNFISLLEIKSDNCCSSVTILVANQSLCKFSSFFFLIHGTFNVVVSKAVMLSYNSLTETLISTFLKDSKGLWTTVKWKAGKALKEINCHTWLQQGTVINVDSEYLGPKFRPLHLQEISKETPNWGNEFMIKKSKTHLLSRSCMRALRNPVKGKLCIAS